MLTNKELKKLLKSREPVMYYERGVREWLEYAYVNAVITRYDHGTGEFYITVELMDRTLHGVVVDKPEYMKRKG